LYHESPHREENQDPELTWIQSLVAIRSANFLLAELALGHACVIAKQMGLHREQYPGEGEPIEFFEERQLVFWVLYTLDKSLSLTLGRHCALPTCECSTPLPNAVGVGDGATQTALARIQLACNQEQIFIKLFSAAAMHHDASERQDCTQYLLEQMAAWKNNSGISATKPSMDRGRADENFGFLFAYHSCLVVILSQNRAPHHSEILSHARKALEYFCTTKSTVQPRYHFALRL
jgi:hypothetical protein